MQMPYVNDVLRIGKRTIFKNSVREELWSDEIVVRINIPVFFKKSRGKHWTSHRTWYG